MLTAEKISKRFSGVNALDEVSMDLLPGCVTAIIGENGAGKSTLMKILSGVYTEYEGRILYKGAEAHFRDPRHAQECGIAIIHQELNLIPHLSITENMFLGRELTNSLGLLDKKAMKAATASLLERLRLNVSPDTLIADLKVGQQQVVEIAKALLTESQVIIMDEPSSAISDHEVDVLFGIISDLKQEGKAIVYISHKLDELFKIADRYIVMRDGKVTEAGSMKDVTSHDTIIRKMTGRDIKTVRRNSTPQDNQVLQVQQLSLAGKTAGSKALLQNISFDVAAGEVVGIFGLMGAGRTELLETILGLHAGEKPGGSILLNGQPVHQLSPESVIKAGLVLVPEDRKRDGFVSGFDIKTNISLSCLNKLQQLGLLDQKQEAALADKYIQSLRIKTNSASQQVSNLSGGNQQKVVLAKCLATQPVVLMLDEPTRGIDANAKNEIYQLILELAANGMAIIMVSSELPEILAISNRVLVMAEGRLTASFPIDAASEDKILKAAIPNTI